MRVLVDYRPALRQRTGVGEYVHELLRALAGHDSPAPAGAVAAFTSSWKDRPAPTAVEELQPVRMVDRRVPVSVLTRAWNDLSWPPVEWLAGRFDVVHAATPVAIPGRAAPVLTIHDLHFLRHPERMAAEMRRDFPRLVQQHAARAGALVVSSAYTAADVVATLGVPAGRVHLCPAGAPRWAGEVRDARAARTPAHVLFLGTLEPRKNLDVLLDAYRALRDRVPDTPPLVLAGRPGEAATRLQAMADTPALSGHVRLTGYVSEDERRALLAGAYMLVLPSLDEGFGLPVLEAMACGVPVVISSGGSLPEVAGDAASPIDPGDVDGFATAMAALLAPEQAAVAAARGLTRAEAFQWSTTARLAWAAYRAAHEAAS